MTTHQAAEDTPYDFTLCPRHPGDDDCRLVKIYSSREVIVRDRTGFAHALPGEHFKNSNGEDLWYWRLKTVDLDTGKVTIEGLIVE